MAKKKKVIKSRSRTGDMASRPMRLGSLTIKTKLTIGGIQYLEDVYDDSLEELSKHIGSGRIRDMVNLMTALAVSSYPDTPVDELRAKIEKVDFTQLSSVVSRLKGVFKVEVKNSSRLAPRKKVKVKGNLTE